MSEELRENKMGTMPVRRLVLSMSLPMMIAMLVQALYNVVDSYFVAKLSENALTAVGMVFPFQNLLIAVGVGTGVGVNAFLSRSLGEKNYDAANRAAENGVFLAVLSTLVFTVAGLTLAHPFIAVQTDIPDIVSSGTAYMRICGGLSFGLFLEIMFERLLQATGRTFYTMLTQGPAWRWRGLPQPPSWARSWRPSWRCCSTSPATTISTQPSGASAPTAR